MATLIVFAAVSQTPACAARLYSVSCVWRQCMALWACSPSPAFAMLVLHNGGVIIRLGQTDHAQSPSTLGSDLLCFRCDVKP